MASNPKTLFIRACSTGKVDVIRQLLQDGLSPETTDTYGLTGLIWIGRKGQVEVAKVLVEAGANLEGADRRGRTALFHAVTFGRHEFVAYLAARGASVNPVDAHGCLPLDLAGAAEKVNKAEQKRTIDLLVRLGAKTTRTPVSANQKKWNSISAAGGCVGGPDLMIDIERSNVQLNILLGKWKGNYTQAIEYFFFSRYIDGSIIGLTEKMQLVGPSKARRGGNGITVKIGIPESWWRNGESYYKLKLAEAMEVGLNSMIALLQRNKHEIQAELLLADWAKVRQEFLETPAPPYPAEGQRAALMAMVEVAKRTVEERKLVAVNKGMQIFAK